MKNYGDKNLKFLRRNNFILTLVLMFILGIIFVIVIHDGILSFILLLSQSFMLTLFYELFKVYLNKSTHIYETYAEYYQHTLLNKTTLDILNLQITTILKEKKINIPSLLYYISKYHQLLNYHVIYNDEALQKFNYCINDYISKINNSTRKKTELKTITLQLMQSLYLINDEAKEYLYFYYTKVEKLYNH